MRLTFISGWAGCPELYPELAANSRFVSPFLHHTRAEVREAIAAGGDTLVGWSTGAHLVLKHLEQAQQVFSRIILIAPFLAFSDSVSPRVVKRMKLRLQHEAEATVSDFWQLCGHEAACPQLTTEQRDNLSAGLDFLASSVVTPPLPVADHLILVRCTEDRVVSVTAFTAVTAALPTARIKEVQSSHMIPEARFLGMIANDCN